MQEPFREPSGFLDLVAGYGPTHRPMDWLYAMTTITRPDWDREWLLRRLQTVCPTNRGKRVAWSLDVRMHYSWDVLDPVGHQYVIKFTDPLVREQFREEVAANVHWLFADVEHELTDTSSRLTGESERLHPGQLAHEHMGGPPPTIDACPPGVTIKAPAFPALMSSMRLTRDLPALEEDPTAVA